MGGSRCAGVVASFGQLRLSIAHAREVPGLGRFLVGRFFYSDAVNTVIVVMSVVIVKALGVSETLRQRDPAELDARGDRDELRLGLAVRSAGPEANACRVLVSWAVGLLLGGIALGFGPAGLVPFLIAGAILGSGLGGVQVADRVLMVRLSPPDRLGEFFGTLRARRQGQPGRRPAAVRR